MSQDNSTVLMSLSKPKSKVYFITIDGPSGGGKSTLSKHIKATLALYGIRVTIVNGDRFYRNAREGENKATRDYDVPDAFDKDLFITTIHAILKGEKVKLPIYSYVLHERLAETDEFDECDVIVLEGILVYWWKEIRECVDLPIYIDVKQEDCLIRRVKRDVRERGRTMESVFDQYKQTVAPAFETFIQPLKKIISEKGIVVPKGGNTINGYNNVIGRIGWDLGLNLGKLRNLLTQNQTCVNEVTE